MKALSILQPYAWLIVNGIKDIENRTWVTGYRGPVLIHAGKRYPKGEYADDLSAYGHQGYPETREEMIGGIVGIATITGCVSHSPSRWFNGPYGFTLSEARALPKLVPMLGALGFFDVPLEILLQLPPGFAGSAVLASGGIVPASTHLMGEKPSEQRAPVGVVTQCPWCRSPVSVANEPYCANADCRWNNGGTRPTDGAQNTGGTSHED